MPPIDVIQNSNKDPEGDGVHCGTSGQHQQDRIFRRFDLSGKHAAAKGFRVSQVVVGVDTANSADSNLPGNIVVWAIDKTDPLTLANLEQLATVPVNYDTVPNESLLTVPIAADVPVGKDMVIEAMVTAGTAGESFYLGANNDSETAPAYIVSPACGVNEPATFASIGYPNKSHIIYAVGKSIECIEAEPGFAPAEADLAAAEHKYKKAKQNLKKAEKNLKDAMESGNAAAIKKATKKEKKAEKKFKAAKADKKHAAAALAMAAVECAQPPLAKVSVRSGTQAPAADGSRFSVSSSGS